MLVWDRLQPHTVPDPAGFWFLLPAFGLLVGALFGNITTFGFPLWAAAVALLFVIAAEAAGRRLGSGKPDP